MKQKNPKQRTKRLSEKSLTAGILMDMVDNLDLIFTIGNRPVAVSRYGLESVLRMRKAENYRLHKQALQRLRAKRLIQLDKNANNYSIALTDSGLAEVFRLKVLKANFFEGNHFCMVIFDIPERHRQLRDKLRYFLKEAGFNSMQKSVWISPFNATKALNNLFVATGAAKWVRVYTVMENN